MIAKGKENERSRREEGEDGIAIGKRYRGTDDPAIKQITPCSQRQILYDVARTLMDPDGCSEECAARTAAHARTHACFMRRRTRTPRPPKKMLSRRNGDARVN